MAKTKTRYGSKTNRMILEGKGVPPIEDKAFQNSDVYIGKNGTKARNMVIANGKVISIPLEIQRGGKSTVTVISGRVYANGFEYKNGEWKRTLKALFHKWF